MDCQGKEGREQRKRCKEERKEERGRWVGEEWFCESCQMGSQW